MLSTRWLTGAVAGVLSAAVAVAGVAHADPVADFYKGRQVSIVVGAGAGGTYGLYGMTLAAYLGRHIPGNPNIVMQYMPGAGGTRAANYVAQVAPKDGSVLGMMIQTIPMHQALKGEGVKFDVGTFNWIGNMIETISVLFVWHQSPASTIEAIRTTEVAAGTTGPGSETYLYPAVLNQLLGTRFRIVAGYPGTAEINVALERREVDASVVPWAGLKANKADWIRDRKIIPVVQVGQRKSRDLPDVPLLTDLAQNDEQRTILELVSSGSTVGRSISTPPNVPADRVAALRKAFEATMKDPEFLAEAKKRKMDIDPVSGAEIEAQIAKILKIPESLVPKARAAVGYK